MEKNTARFGTISYGDDDTVKFPEGLIGFPFLREFVMVEHKEGNRFRWLQSLDDESTAFLVVDPNAFFPEYAPVISDADASDLELDERAAALVLSTVSIPPGRPQDMTLNLAAPIIVNAGTREAKQVVLEDEAYTIRQRVFPTGAEDGQAIAA